MEIWLNPACSKCRTALAALDDSGIDYTVRRYLDDVPSAEELGAVAHRLALEPWDLARSKEAREAGISFPRDAEHRQQWLEAMVAHPATIQRPIVTATDGTTVIGRDAVALAAVIAAE